jgi:hypothetical protein
MKAKVLNPRLRIKIFYAASTPEWQLAVSIGDVLRVSGTMC